MTTIYNGLGRFTDLGILFCHFVSVKWHHLVGSLSLCLVCVCAHACVCECMCVLVGMSIFVAAYLHMHLQFRSQLSINLLEFTNPTRLAGQQPPPQFSLPSVGDPMNTPGSNVNVRTELRSSCLGGSFI